MAGWLEAELFSGDLSSSSENQPNVAQMFLNLFLPAGKFSFLCHPPFP